MKLVWGRLDGGGRKKKKKELLVPAVKVGSEARPQESTQLFLFWRQWASTSGLTFHPDLTIVLHRYGRRDCNAALPLPRPLRLSDEQKYFTDTPVRVELHFVASKSTACHKTILQRVNADVTNTKLVSGQR